LVVCKIMIKTEEKGRKSEKREERREKNGK
jgi:hypothetical protein